MEEQTNSNAIVNNRPWLTFGIEDVAYALDSILIQTIMNNPEDIVAVPEMPHYIRGMANVRGSVIPVLDLRALYGITSLEKEYEDFKVMIETRKQDHIRWIAQLENSIDTGVPFTLAKNPHECAFGRWYYGFESGHQAVNFVLKKIEEPHSKLHRIAAEMIDCPQEHSQCKRSECLKITLKNAKEELMPHILGLLDEVKEIFRHQYQEKLIVLESEGRKIGVVVDSVNAIDYLTEAAGHEDFALMTRGGYISAIGRGQKSDELVLMVEGKRLLDLVQDGQMANKSVL